jgi:hypothetical protein
VSLYVVRPISDRTAFTGKHKDSAFTVTYSQAIDLLERELRHLRARDIVVEVDVPESAIRLDGMLRADARAASPAVRLAFDSTVGPLTYATDRFIRPSYRRGGMQQDWQHNLYAIALSLEALRRVDRYEVTKRGEQYAGFKALPAGQAMPASHLTRTDAELIIGRWSGHHGGPYDVEHLVKRARFATHPDRHDGDRTAWDQVEEAAKVLGVI